MYTARLEPVATAVKRPNPKANLPAWARKALANRHFRGLTVGGRLAVSRPAAMGPQGGWMTRGGPFVPFAFEGRNLPVHTHATRERMLVAVGEHGRQTLWEVDLASSQTRPVSTEPGSSGLYLDEVHVLTSSPGRTSLWRVEDDVRELAHVRGGRAPLAGPFEVDGRLLALAEDRVSIGHRATVYVVEGETLTCAGELRSGEPAGFGGYGVGPFASEGTLYIKSQKKRPGGVAWYRLALAPAATVE